MSVDLKKLNDKFFTDPDWKEVEELLTEYLSPFESVMNIDSKLSNDQIASEVRGRQLMVENLNKFLLDTKVIRQKINSQPKSYK